MLTDVEKEIKKICDKKLPAPLAFLQAIQLIREVAKERDRAVELCARFAFNKDLNRKKSEHPTWTIKEFREWVIEQLDSKGG